MVPDHRGDDQSSNAEDPLEDQDFYPQSTYDEDLPDEWFETDASDGPSERDEKLIKIKDQLAHKLSQYFGLPPVNEVESEVMSAYLEMLDRDEYEEAPDLPLSSTVQQRDIDARIERELLWLRNIVCSELNSRYGVKAANGLPTAFRLSPPQIAALLCHLFLLAEITPGGLEIDDSVGILSVYQRRGEHQGVYRRADAGFLEAAAQRFNAALGEKGYKEVERLVRLRVPKVEENLDRDLIFVRDEIFNYRTDERMAFTPDIVRTTKIPHRLPKSCPEVPQALGASGQLLWNFEKWHTGTLPDEGTRNALWQVYGMSVRPLVDWQKMVALYNESGSNGKGTILDMIEAISGRANTAHVALEAYDSQFGASSLIGKRLNLIHEVPVNAFMKRVDKLKSIITNDAIEIDRKHKDPISYKPQLVNIAALNGALQFGDKTESMERRVMILPMDMHFPDGKKDRAIKDDYVKRAEVSEYILYKVLVEMPKYWELTVPETAKEAMNQHRLETNNVAAFVHAFKDEFARPFLPLTMLRDFYSAWLKKHSSSAKPVPTPTFNREIQGLLEAEGWMVPTTDKGAPRKFGKVWLNIDEPALDEFSGDREVDKWRFARRPDPLTREANWSLGENLPRQTRGLMRKDIFEAWEAEGCPTDEMAIRNLLTNGVAKSPLDQAIASMTEVDNEPAFVELPTNSAPVASPPPLNETNEQKLERLTLENEALRNGTPLPTNNNHN